jgi:hypothetical protein
MLIELYLEAIEWGGGIPGANDSFYALLELCELHLRVCLILSGRNGSF